MIELRNVLIGSFTDRIPFQNVNALKNEGVVDKKMNIFTHVELIFDNSDMGLLTEYVEKTTNNSHLLYVREFGKRSTAVIEFCFNYFSPEAFINDYINNYISDLKKYCEKPEKKEDMFKNFKVKDVTFEDSECMSILDPDGFINKRDPYETAYTAVRIENFNIILLEKTLNKYYKHYIQQYGLIKNGTLIFICSPRNPDEDLRAKLKVFDDYISLVKKQEESFEESRKKFMDKL